MLVLLICLFKHHNIRFAFHKTHCTLLTFTFRSYTLTFFIPLSLYLGYTFLV